MNIDYIIVDRDFSPGFEPFYAGNLKRRLDGDSMALGAVMNREVAGLLVGRLHDAFLWIDWLYVPERLRGNGIGSGLVETMISHAADVIEIRGICAVSAKGEMSEFLESLLFRQEDNVYYEYQTTLGSRIDLPAAKKKRSCIQPVRGVGRQSITRLSNHLYQNPGIPRGVPLPIVPKHYSANSVAYVRDGEVLAMILLTERERKIVINWAYVEENHRALLGSVAQEVIASLEKKYPPDTPVVFGVLRKGVLMTAKKLFPNGEVRELYRYVYEF